VRTARWRNLAFAAAHVADSLARSAFGFASVRSAWWLSHLSGVRAGTSGILGEFLENSGACTIWPMFSIMDLPARRAGDYASATLG